MESSLGANFAAVRIHESSYATSLGALAFVRGSDIHFAPGRYDPSSSAGLKLLGHELGHVVQQQQGRVAATSQLGDALLNDDPSLEHEADEMGARAAHSVRVPAHKSPTASGSDRAAQGPVQLKPDEDAAARSDIGPSPGPYRVAEMDPAGTTTTAGPPIQLAPNPKLIPKDRIPIQIVIDHEMTADELSLTADIQVFGLRVPGPYRGMKAHYTPADSPLTIYFPASMIQRYRAQAKGIDLDEKGGVVGADARKKQLSAQPAGDEKTALLAEIDRRYAAIMHSGDKIHTNETAKHQLWNQLRDEVLFQQDHLKTLPDNVRLILKQNTRGRQLLPADYDQLFRIAKKIENLPPGAAADYASKINSTTTDLNVLEAALATYTADLARRDQQDAGRTATMNKLLGLEEIYKLYRQYEAMEKFESSMPELAIANAIVPGSSTALYQQLERELPRYGFRGVAELKQYINQFEQQFEDGAATLAIELLQKYAGKLYKEQQRYTDPNEVKTLHGKLTGFRDQQQEADKQNAVIRTEENERFRTSVDSYYLQPKGPVQVRAEARGAAAQKAAAQSIKDLSVEYPIFAEDNLPEDQRLSLEALARADAPQLGNILLAHIAARQQVVIDANTRIDGKHAVIYKMDKLMPMFYAAMDIQPGSIHDLIIQAKIQDDEIQKIVVGIALALVAVALTVVSFGAATPALIAAGASIGAAGLSTYMAYDEYKEYTESQALADAGYADDPSVLWLVLAIAGASVDMGSTVKAVRALAPAAKALEAGGELSRFTEAVEALQKAKQLDEKIATAAEKAAKARRAYTAANSELSSALRGKMYSFPGPLVDPEVLGPVVKMAVAKIQQGGHSLGQFIDEIRQARLAAKLGDLTPEELVKVKEAWATAEVEAKNEANALELEQNAAQKELPLQDHHFATNKNKLYTPQMEKIANQYGLDLDDLWNIESLPHLGKHPKDYHEFVLRGMQQAAREAGSDKAKFLQLFDKYVKDIVRKNPDLLRKSGWK